MTGRFKEKMNGTMNKQLSMDSLISILPIISFFIHFMFVYELFLTDLIEQKILFGKAICSFALIMPLLIIEMILPISFSILCCFNAVVFGVFYYVNLFVFAARERPIHYIDFFCISDALVVRDRYSFPMTKMIAVRLVIGFVLTILAIFVIQKWKRKYKFSQKMIACGTFVIIMLYLLWVGVSGGYLSFEPLKWDEKKYVECNGLWTSIVTEFVNSSIKKPKEYSSKNADEILQRYSMNTEDSSATNLSLSQEAPKNIIVIMNEALADFSLIGELDLYDDPLPFIHSLNQNCAKGKMAVNVYGSSTCNTEFEFLTGNALYFMPNESIPFVQYSLKNCESIVSDLHQLGYTATAVHPFYAQEWKRTQNYKNLGFDLFISGEKFADDYEGYDGESIFEEISGAEIVKGFGSGLEYYRGFISDRECYKKVLETMKGDNDSGNQSFVFAVTMQNHGGYDRNDFIYENMQGYTKNHESVIEQYLNLCRISDNAFQELISELEEYPEKTVVLMFGDHEPNLLSFDHFLKVYSEGGNEWEQIADRYYVPYVLWANYDINFEEVETLSVNYLSAFLKKNINLPLSSFDHLRLAVMDEFPVITWNYCMDHNEAYLSPDDIRDNRLIKDYQFVQYRRLFDH